MRTIKVFVYTRQDLEKSRQQVCKVLEELEGKRLTPFGQLRQDNAKRTIERVDKQLATDADTFLELAGRRSKDISFDTSLGEIVEFTKD